MAITKGQVAKVIIISLIAILITAFILMMVLKVQIVTGQTFKIRFDHIGSLTVGGVVRTGGVRIGTVSEIDIDKTDYKSVLVTVMLYPGYKVRKNSRFVVQSGSLIGDQYIEIIQGNTDEFIEEGEIFEGAPIMGIDTILQSSDVVVKDLAIAISILNKTLQKNEQNLTVTLNNIQEITTEINRYLHDQPTGEKSLLSKIYTVFDNLEKATDEINKLFSKFNSSDSALSLLNEKKTKIELEATLHNLKTITNHLAVVSEGLKKLMQEITGSTSIKNTR